MKITIELDQKAMSKTRKFVYFTRNLFLTDCMNTVQAKIVAGSFRQLGIEVTNNTGLIL